MPTEVTMWKAADGSVWPTKDRAEQHDRVGFARDAARLLADEIRLPYQEDQTQDLLDAADLVIALADALRAERADR